MIKVLITGSNSYVGTNVKKWLMKKPDKYHVETLDMKNSNWKNFDFSSFNVVFHVAGIVHIKENNKKKDLYFKVNRDLAFEVAIKSKKERVENFIFMSSMSVFGLTSGVITNDTVPKPTSLYGKSKLEAEDLIINLRNSNFNVTILRPPMIYGIGSPGNFSRMKKISKYLFFFTDTNNKRSILFIDNFCIILDNIITKKLSGYFHPENKEKSSTFDLISMIRDFKGKKTVNFYLFLPIIKILVIISNNFKKIFGSLYYDINKRYETTNLYNLKESIEKSVNKNE